LECPDWTVRIGKTKVVQSLTAMRTEPYEFDNPHNSSAHDDPQP
jgi:hypothetical protein